MKLEPLEKDRYYHIYNRGINGCAIFKNEGNYYYFMKLFSKYLTSHATVYAYCLLSNHFHFVIKIDDNGVIVTQKFSNFFNASAKVFNKQQDRTGSLFEKHFKRIQLQSDNYLTNLILYIHTNPVKHNLVDNFKNYQYSSYIEIVNNKSEFINSKEVIDLFQDIDNFKYAHQYKNSLISEKYTFE